MRNFWDQRYAQRVQLMRSSAIRELLKLGLASAGIKQADGSKSSDYGVLRRGPNSYTDGNEA